MVAGVITMLIVIFEGYLTVTEITPRGINPGGSKTHTFTLSGLHTRLRGCCIVRCLPTSRQFGTPCGAAPISKAGSPCWCWTRRIGLTVPLFNTLRRLLNFAMEHHDAVCADSGRHTELRQKLALRLLEAMRQRVTLAYHLRPFTRDETAAYLQHHLQLVGIDRPVFTEAVVATGHEWAHGLQRCAPIYLRQIEWTDCQKTCFRPSWFLEPVQRCQQ